MNKSKHFVPSKKAIVLGLSALVLGFVIPMLTQFVKPANLEPLRAKKLDETIQTAPENVGNASTIGADIKGVATITPTPKPTIHVAPTNAVVTPTLASEVARTSTFVLRVLLPDDKPAASSTVKLIAPDKSVNTYSVDNDGNLTLRNLLAGNYTVYIYHANKTYDRFFTLQAGQTRTIIVTVDYPANPTSTPAPTPIPDTQAPELTGVSGPYDWGSQGWCVVVYRNQIVDDDTSNEFMLSYALDGTWGDWGLMQATKCYTDTSAGTHTISAKVKDPAGNVSNVVNVSFTK